MILIIGAEASGKREFAKSLGYSDDDFTTDPFDGKRVVYGVQNILFADHTRTQELYDALADKEVVICNEVAEALLGREAGNGRSAEVFWVSARIDRGQRACAGRYGHERERR